MASADAATAAGRFLPPDPRVEEPYRLTPQVALRVAVLGGVALAVFARALPPPLGAAGALGPTVPARAQNNQVRTIRVDAPRGPILDRNGRVLVDKHAGTAVAALAGRPAEARDALRAS